jgi:putative aminopeptidase FrvX
MSLISELLLTHSPAGDEKEVDEIALRELRKSCDKVWCDEFENVVGFVKGGSEPPVCVAAHKDEVAMLVKRVEEDGRLRIEPIGGAYTWKLGEGPVQVMSAKGLIDGVLAVGCAHTTAETGAMQQARTGALAWTSVGVETKMSRADLRKAGVGPGTRVVVHRSRKQPLVFRGFVGGFALDDKVGVAILLACAQELKRRKRRLPGPVYFAATAEEEVGAAAGGFLARKLGVETLIAIETGPAEKEYDVQNSAQPVVWYKDSGYLYHKPLCDRLSAIAERLGFGAQRAAYSSAGSEASYAHRSGLLARCACLAFPTQYTHGYEVANVSGIVNTARVLTEYLLHR